MIDSGGNDVANTFSATSSIGFAAVAAPVVRLPTLPAARSWPSVADVATGQIEPSGRPGRAAPTAEASRRSSIATSVPCAPS